jgi:hypothetical protein
MSAKVKETQEQAIDRLVSRVDTTRENVESILRNKSEGVITFQNSEKFGLDEEMKESGWEWNTVVKKVIDKFVTDCWIAWICDGLERIAKERLKPRFWDDGYTVHPQMADYRIIYDLQSYFDNQISGHYLRFDKKHMFIITNDTNEQTAYNKNGVEIDQNTKD